MAVKNKRIGIYLLQDVGTDGRVDMQYVLQPSARADGGYWAAVSFIGMRETQVGGQAQRTATYDVTTGSEVPFTLALDADAYITVLPANTRKMRVMSVAEIDNTGERQARCIEASDTGVTLTE